MFSKYKPTGDVLLSHDMPELQGMPPLYRIRALIDIPRHNVKAGDLGGWIESEDNLSHAGDCWIGGNAIVFGGATVGDNALVGGYAVVEGEAAVGGDAKVCGHARINGKAAVYGRAWITDNVAVRDSACVHGDAVLLGDVVIKDRANVHRNARLYCSTEVGGDALVMGVSNAAAITGNEIVYSRERG